MLYPHSSARQHINPKGIACLQDNFTIVLTIYLIVAVLMKNNICVGNPHRSHVVPTNHVSAKSRVHFLIFISKFILSVVQTISRDVITL